MKSHWLRLGLVIFVLAFFASLGCSANNFYPNNTYPVIAGYIARIFNLPFNSTSARNRSQSLSLLWGAFVSMAQVGLMFSCFVTPVLADNLGRKKTIIVSALGAMPGILMEACSYYTDAWYLLYVGRFFSQLFAYMLQQTLPIFICEIATPSIRGRCAVTTSIAYGLGVLTASVLGLGNVLGTSTQWNVSYFIFAGLVFLSLPTMMWMRESPVFLAKIAETPSEIRRSLEFYRGSDTEFESVMADSRNGNEKISGDGSFKLLALFKNEALHKQIVLTLLISIIYNVGNAMNSYSTIILLNAGFASATAGYCTVAIFASSISIGILCWFVADIISRRKHFIGSVWFCASSLILLAIFDNLYISTRNVIFSGLCLASLFGVQLSFAFGIRPLFWILIAEIFPYQFRSTAKSISYFVYSCSSIGFSLLIPLMVDNISGWTYILLSAPLLISLPFCHKFLPETSAQDSNEIYRNLVNDDRKTLLSYGTTISRDDLSFVGIEKPEKKVLR